MDQEDQSKISDIILHNTWEPEDAKRQKSIVDLENHAEGEAKNGGRLYMCCNLFCCKDVIQSKDVEWDAIGITEVGKKEFGLFLKAMKGLSMKDGDVGVHFRVYILISIRYYIAWYHVAICYLTQHKKNQCANHHVLIIIIKKK